MPSNWATHGRRATRCSCERRGEPASGPAVGHPLAAAIPTGKRDRRHGSDCAVSRHQRVKPSYRCPGCPKWTNRWTKQRRRSRNSARAVRHPIELPFLGGGLRAPGDAVRLPVVRGEVGDPRGLRRNPPRSHGVARLRRVGRVLSPPVTFSVAPQGGLRPSGPASLPSLVAVDDPEEDLRQAAAQHRAQTPRTVREAPGQARNGAGRDRPAGLDRA